MSSTAAELVKPGSFMTDSTVEPRFSRTSSVRPDSRPPPIHENQRDCDIGVASSSEIRP